MTSQIMSESPARPERVSIGGVPIDIVSQNQAVRYVGTLLDSKTPQMIRIAGVNAHFVNIARRDKQLGDFLRKSTLNVADGASILLAARVFGRKIPERVTGIDLMVDLCKYAAESGKSVYLFGGMDGAAEGAASWMHKHLPSLRIVGVDRPEHGKEFDPVVVEQVRTRIRTAQPDFLFVCLGVPRQELWIEQFTSDLPVKVVMGNGAAFDVLAGFFVRPSQRIQELGLEWAYRLWKEPARLWRRYLIGNLTFSMAVLGQLAATLVRLR